MHFDALYKITSMMTNEEVTRAIFVDHLTQTWNRRAYEMSGHSGPIAIVDLDSLKWTNTHMGFRCGDTALTQLSEVLKKYFDDDVYRIGGDEFAIQSDSINKLFVNLMEAQTVAKGYQLEDEGYLLNNSCSFSFGVGSTLEETDELLRADKIFRQSVGLRACTGDNPPGVVIK